ncbi:MAG: patatin-like phospholipase family protein [Xanthomonadales bacterium]
MKKPKHTLSRRDLLSAIPWLAVPAGMVSAAPAAAASDPAKPVAKTGATRRRIGLALGAGGANGLAHIEMLEVLEEMGLRPHRMAGSSIGAVIGAMFASGMSAADIRQLANQAFATDEDGLLDTLMSDQATHWLELVELEVGDGGLLDSRRILSHFYGSIGKRVFEDLEIPLDIVAGDLWDKKQVVLNQGPLLPAVQASMAIPGIFEPVQIDDRVLIDGGTVNPVPWDLLFADCDIVIGIDVSGVRSRPESGETGYFQILFNSIKVMQKAIVNAKMRHQQPDIFIAPEIKDVRALEFYSAERVFEQAKPARTQLRNELSALLAAD